MKEEIREAIEQFERDFKSTVEAVGGNHVVYQKFANEFAVFPELNDTVDQYLLVLGVTKNPAAQARLKKEATDAMYKTLCQVFIRLRGRGAFTFSATEFTSELQDETVHMEQWAGLREQPVKPLPPKSAEQLLSEEVILDFCGDAKADPPVAPLPTAKFRAKLNSNAAYRAMYEKLVSENLLTSQSAVFTHIGHVGG